jgi:hypothetical protein
MSLEKLVTISSSDKNDNLSENNSDFTVILNERNLSQGVNRVLIKECTVPNVFPNIRGPANYNASFNNLLIIDKQGVGLLPVIVPEGQYVISTLGVPPPNDLITVLTSLIDAAIAPDTVTITLDPITNKLNFTFSSANYKFIENTITTPTPLNNVLGIVNETPAYTNSIDADGLPDLSGLKNVYIHSKDIADLNGVDAGFGLISLAEPVSLVDTPYGAYAYKQNNDDELASIVFEQPRNLSVIRVVLRDEKGTKLDIGTHEMNIVFKAYFDAV